MTSVCMVHLTSGEHLEARRSYWFLGVTDLRRRKAQQSDGGWLSRIRHTQSVYEDLWHVLQNGY